MATHSTMWWLRWLMDATDEPGEVTVMSGDLLSAYLAFGDSIEGFTDFIKASLPHLPPELQGRAQMILDHHKRLPDTPPEPQRGLELLKGGRGKSDKE